MTPPSDPKSVPDRTLPNSAICRTHSIGLISDFGNCLVDRPIECPYVLYFGEGNICRHPGWKNFLNFPEEIPIDKRKST